MKSLVTTFLLLIVATLLKAQSTSVFDANYFNKDNIAPPIKIGKGFHMNDIYRQTRSCFTPESAHLSKLSAQQTGGKKTNIKLFYTQNNSEYNDFKSRGASGKVSFLNLFSIGGSKLEEFSNKTIRDEERLIFTANVDFGFYSYDIDPLLSADAKSLINESKVQEFVNMYGTHYISGIRKESFINVILTKSSSKEGHTESSLVSSQGGGKVPYKVKGAFELDNRNSTDKFIENNEFSVIVEIHGPAIDQGILQNKIKDVLSGNETSKADAIAEILGSAIGNISDPNQSYITQYYYSPFLLYGLNGIYWDEKKQNLLTKINEAVVGVYSSKSQIEEITSPSGKKQLEDGLKEKGIPDEYIKKITTKYAEVIPKLKNYYQKANECLTELESRYVSCSDIYCSDFSVCCNNESYLKEIETFNFDGRITDEVNEIIKVAEGVGEELNKPECEKQQKGIIVIHNLSTNPYYIYNGDKFIETLAGKTYQTYYVSNGVYNFKAVQKSGYVMYPTENYRTAIIGKICEEVVLKVGFAD